MSTDFEREVAQVETIKVDGLSNPDEQTVRLYCWSVSSHWRLQVRGRMRLKTTMTREVVVASAHLNADDLRALRDAITTMLKEGGLE